MTKISLIIAMHNDEKYIQRCLDSIVNQTCTDFQVICVDDASTDDTVSICKTYANKLVLSIIRMDINCGLSAVRQRGLVESKCDYVCFVDADDELYPQYVEVAIREMKNSSCDVCLFRVAYVNEGVIHESPCLKKGMKMISKIDIECFYDQIIHEYHLSDSWDKIYKRSFIMNSGVTFRMNKGINGSDALFNKMLFLHKPLVYSVPDILYIHYTNPNSMVTRPNKDFIQMAITTYENLYDEIKTLGYLKTIVFLRALFYEIVRKDLLNKLDKKIYNDSFIRIKNYIRLHEDLTVTITTNVSLKLFQYLILYYPSAVMTYLYAYKSIKCVLNNKLYKLM